MTTALSVVQQMLWLVVMLLIIAVFCLFGWQQWRAWQRSRAGRRALARLSAERSWRDGKKVS